MKLLQRPEIIFTLAGLLFCSVLFIIALDYDVQSRSMPLGVAVLSIALSLLLLIAEFYPPLGRHFIGGYFSTLEKAKQPNLEEMPKHSMKNLAYTFVFILGSFLLILCFGFLMGGPVSIFIWLKWRANISWFKSTLGGCISYVALLFLFKMAMGLNLFQGIFFGAIVT
jgi:hypothetical protein